MKTKKGGKKKDQDDLNEAGGMGGVADSDLGKKGGKRNKLKGQQDDVTDGALTGPASKKRKGDTETGTNFGTNPTQKDFL